MDVSLSNIPLGGADWMDYSTGGEEEEEGGGKGNRFREDIYN